MRNILTRLLALMTIPVLSGCIARTVVDVATAPVRVGSKAVDMATTSQSEADEKRGRELRHREERLGRLERDYRRHSGQCANGDEDACVMARAEYDEMQAILPTLSAERD